MNNNILVLGGSSGIGLDTSIYLNSIGYTVYIAARTNPNINDLNYIYVDIDKESSIETLFKYFMNNDIKLYGLVYAIGITLAKRNIMKFTVKEFNNIISTNVTGAILSLKYSYKLLKKTQGRVVIVNSIATKTFSKFSGIEYTISKNALSGLVKQLSQEWAKDKILINSIYPSMTQTKMLENALSKEKIQNIQKDIPLKRLAKTKEIAKSIAFLLDEDISYITGTGLNINGGIYLNG
jgi:3-oxoacyl-[acyl-carrier protein] reductase